MKRFFICLILCLLMLSSFGCAFRDNSFRAYNEFAIKSAKMGLWSEAVMRWKRLSDLYPNDPKTHNNLAIAYEAKGEYDLAKTEYQKAIELEPNNRIYLRNYYKFMKNYEKSKKTKEDIENVELPDQVF